MNRFQKIYVENFGPIIKSGNKPVEFKRCTIFIGDQGTGKSTIVKLYSTLIWLEKLIIAKKNSNSINISDFKKFLSQQNIPIDYISSSTLIEYTSNVLFLLIKNNKLVIRKIGYMNDDYICPKIQYIPSERNLLSIVSNLQEISRLPEMLIQLNREFQLAYKEILNIYFQNFKLQHNIKNNENYVLVGRKKTKLNQSSSGLQSIYPLVFVSKYLKKMLSKNFLERLSESDDNRRQLVINLIDDANDREKISNYIMSKLDTKFNSKKIKELETQFSNIINSCLIEIVEEPEQNLFPISQVELLKNIIEDTCGDGDKLILTTHSPYILSQINNYIFAYENRSNIYGKNSKLLFDLSEVSAYKIQNGKIKSIIDKEYRGIDVLEIDECSRKISNEFEKIMEKE